MPCQRGALKELDYGPPARRIGDVSAGAQDTYVEAACRRASPARGMSSGPPAAPCRSAECKEYLFKIGALCGKVALRPSVMNPARDKLEAINLAYRCIRLHTYHGQSYTHGYCARDIIHQSTPANASPEPDVQVESPLAGVAAKSWYARWARGTPSVDH
jgi:hypothetical protein